MTVPAKVLAALEALPTVSDAAVKLNRLLSDPEVRPAELAAVVRTDPALTANLLKVVNSAAMGLRRTVSSVDQAAQMLGQRGLLRIASMALLGKVLPPYLPGYGLGTQEFWNHCSAVAVLSDLLARRVGLAVPELAFTAGLLHDVGKLAIGVALDEELQGVIESVDEHDLDLFTAEQHRLGTDHCETGRMLAELWSLPAPVVEVIAMHHAPPEADPAHRDLVYVVHVANGFAHSVGFGADVGGMHRRVWPEVLDTLEIDDTAAGEILADGLDAICALNEACPV